MMRWLCMAVLAGPALAECPVAGDLTVGIRVAFDDDSHSIFRQFRPDVIASTNYYPDDYVGRTLLARGVYVIELTDMIDGQLDPSARTTFAFSEAAKNLPLPAAGATQKFKTVVSDTYDNFAEDISVLWGDETRITYGDCAYQMLPGTFSYTSTAYDHEEVVHYLPELGFALLYTYDDADLPKPDKYSVTEIAKVTQ